MSVSTLEAVKGYVKDQAGHNRTKSFQEEYVTFLKKHAVVYDEKYLW